MWKRLNHQRGSRQPAIGGPVLNETTLDENTYADGLGMDVNRAQSPQDGSGAPSRPPRNNMSKGLPTLPFETSLPPAHENQESRFRPASSIYSQPSPNPITSRFPAYSYLSTTAYNDGVSPPSSPEIGATIKKSNQGQPDDHDVSPIDETSDISPLGFRGPPSRPGSSSKPPSSSIPVLRREKKRNQVAAAASNLVSRKEVGNASKDKKTVDVRWDPYSGEQTTSEKGKPQSVKPGQFTPPGLQSVHESTGRMLGNESIITAVPKTQKSFGERVRNLRANTPAPAEKPEWKGASGRATLVSPVADQIDIAPLNIPRKSSKRVASPHSAQSGSSTTVSVFRSGGGGETVPASAQMPEHIDPSIKSVLANSGRSSPRLLNSPIPVTPGPVAKGTPNYTQASADASEGNYQQHQRRDSISTLERNFREALKDVSFSTGDSSDPYVQPPSRFSVTTYAPSEAQSTPRPSTDTFDRPPMPSPPKMYTTTQELTPILNRTRPKVGESPKTTTRKAVAPSPPIFISMSSSIASKRSSNIAKTLPQSPAEVQSIDLIGSLQAQLDDLAHRRNNIMKSIRQMTELMPTDKVLITDEVRRKREVEKRKVEGLREEEADIRRLEHEIGLRLHRAWKRKDKDATYEPTGLWVRRVTG